MKHTKNFKRAYFKRLPILLLVGLGLGLLFGLLDALVHTYVLHRSDLYSQIFTPLSGNVAIRILVIFLFIAFAFYANYLLYQRDIAENRLRVSEENYRRLIDLSSDAIAIQSEDKIVFINTAGAKLFGTESPDALVGKSVWDFVLPENREQAIKRYQLMCERGAQTQIEQRFIRSDGSYVDIEITVVPFNYEGKPAIQSIFRDITARKQDEDELIRLRKAVETSGEIIFLTDQNGIITYVNPEFSRVYGYQSFEVINKVTPRILKSGAMNHSDYERFWRAILSKQVVKGEFVNRCRDGRLISIEGSANPILDDSGEIIGFLAVQRDISDRKQAQENKKLTS